MKLYLLSGLLAALSTSSSSCPIGPFSTGGSKVDVNSMEKLFRTRIVPFVVDSGLRDAAKGPANYQTANLSSF